MSPELRELAAFATAATVTYLATPIAIRIAVRTSFLDQPAGYKGHGRPTPYLGGSAIILGILVAVFSITGINQAHWTIILAAIAIWAMGTLDDKISLPISLRTLIEAGIAVLLWSTGRGWNAFHYPPADLALTLLWVIGVMNAFNLMDNMDGASATIAAVSATGTAALALVSGDTALATLAFTIAGACAGFLPRNLAKPARIFMGDGGSLLIGLLIARVTMAAVTRHYLGPSGVIIAALLVSLVIFDTTLVTVSRTRADRSILAGGRDHVTHRLARRLRTPRKVVLTLATAQTAVCGITIAVAQAGRGWVLLAGLLGIAFAAIMIRQLDKPVLAEDQTGASKASATLSSPTSVAPQHTSIALMSDRENAADVIGPGPKS